MFLVFTYDNYHPGGGMNDFKGVFSTYEEALEHLRQQSGEYGEISEIKGMLHRSDESGDTSEIIGQSHNVERWTRMPVWWDNMVVNEWKKVE